MGVLSETAGPDVLAFRPVERWAWPTETETFLAMLGHTPTLGATDADRVRRFLTFPAAAYMPRDLREAIAGLTG